LVIKLTIKIANTSTKQRQQLGARQRMRKAMLATVVSDEKFGDYSAYSSCRVTKTTGKAREKGS